MRQTFIGQNWILPCKCHICIIYIIYIHIIYIQSQRFNLFYKRARAYQLDFLSNKTQIPDKDLLLAVLHARFFTTVILVLPGMFPMETSSFASISHRMPNICVWFSSLDAPVQRPMSERSLRYDALL